MSVAFITLLLFMFMSSASAQSVPSLQPAVRPYTTFLPTCEQLQPDQGTWVSRASMPTPRSETAAAVIDDLIYVPGGFGGPDVFEVYDVKADKWRTLRKLPEGRNHLMTAALSGYVYVFGGGRDSSGEATNTAWKYDPAKDTWSELAKMPEPRYAGAAVALDNYLYVAGGMGGTQALLRYDPKSDSWTTLKALQEPREHFAAVAFAGKIYALAGRWQGKISATVEVYDPAKDIWSWRTSMREARSGFGATVVGGYIIVAGGEVFGSGEPKALTSVECYDSPLGGWAMLPSLPVGIHGNPVASVDRSLFVLGGSDRAAGVDNRGRVFMYTIP